MRHTKIVATVGPASDTDATLDALIAAGVDVFRLNFSHGTRDGHAVTCARVRAAAARAGREVAVLQDLSGPKVRTGRLKDGHAIPLEKGGTLRIATGDEEGGPGLVYTTYADLARTVRPGRELLLDDGRVVLRVEDTDGLTIRTTVVHGSELGQHKGINAPGAALPAVGLTEKDRADLEAGLEIGVDLVALSFVQRAEDLDVAREALEAAGKGHVPLVAKLERPEAIEKLDEVLLASDAVMVARGDLGLELPLERVPRVQKEITKRARALGRPVIVATQVLESMRVEPRPTRAEVSDAANAVNDGVDAIMLSGETATGQFPVRVVETLHAIVCDAETLPPMAVDQTGLGPMHAPHGRALCEAAVTLAGRGHLEAIVAVTRGGNTARMLSALRPRAIVLAATDRPDVARRLALCRSVIPVVTTLEGDVDAVGQHVGSLLLERGLLRPGDEAVFVNVHADVTRRNANFLMLQRL